MLALRLLAARGSTPSDASSTCSCSSSSSCFGPDCGSSVFIYVFHLFNSKRRLPIQRCRCRSVCLVPVAFAFSVSAPLHISLPPSPTQGEPRICLLWFWRFSSLNAFELIYNLLMLMYLCRLSLQSPTTPTTPSTPPTPSPLAVSKLLVVVDVLPAIFTPRA